MITFFGGLHLDFINSVWKPQHLDYFLDAPVSDTGNK